MCWGEEGNGCVVAGTRQMTVKIPQDDSHVAGPPPRLFVTPSTCIGMLSLLLSCNCHAVHYSLDADTHKKKGMLVFFIFLILVLCFTLFSRVIFKFRKHGFCVMWFSIFCFRLHTIQGQTGDELVSFLLCSALISFRPHTHKHMHAHPHKLIKYMDELRVPAIASSVQHSKI